MSNARLFCVAFVVGITIIMVLAMLGISLGYRGIDSVFAAFAAATAWAIGSVAFFGDGALRRVAYRIEEEK